MKTKTIERFINILISLLTASITVGLILAFVKRPILILISMFLVVFFWVYNSLSKYQK